jgi:hypothetical protein
MFSIGYWLAEGFSTFRSRISQRHSTKEEEGRGITKLNDIFAREPGMPTITIMVNEYGMFSISVRGMTV